MDSSIAEEPKGLKKDSERKEEWDEKRAETNGEKRVMGKIVMFQNVNLP